MGPTFVPSRKDLRLHTSGSDWSEVANKLSRFPAWEFEDYSHG
ncbi:MAG TPA: Imm8 family immunity protein [Ilumatobacter sp.]